MKEGREFILVPSAYMYSHDRSQGGRDSKRKTSSKENASILKGALSEFGGQFNADTAEGLLRDAG